MADFLMWKLFLWPQTRLQVKPLEIYKGKLATFLLHKKRRNQPKIADLLLLWITSTIGTLLKIDKATNAIQRKKDPTKIVDINATQNIASSCNNRNGEFNYHKEGDEKNMTGVNNFKHAEILLTKDVVLSTTAGKSKQKQTKDSTGIKAKLNKKNVIKWVARPPKDNNLQQKLSQAKDVIYYFLRSSNVIDVDTGVTDGGKELELEVDELQFEVHLPAVKPITTSNSFKHLEEFDKDREVCYFEGMKKASSAANIASFSNTSSTTIINTRQTVTLKDDAQIYAQDKLTKPDRDSASKLRTKSPEDEEDECDPDYGVEQESNTEEGSDEEFEECDSSDEDTLIDAFSPKTSWKGEKVEDAVSQHRQSLINNGNLSSRSVSRNANSWDFISCMNDCGMVDAGYKGLRFTWFNARKRSKKIWKRLDRTFINQHWIDSFSIIDIEHLASTGSNHTPMIVKYSTSEHPKIRYFKFLNFWIDQPNFKDVVQEAWNEDVDGNSMRRLDLKMKNVSRKLSLWSREHIGNVFDKVREWEAKMLDLETDYIENDNDDLRPQIHKTQAEHTRWLKCE
ncbi:hypothetical protein KY289_007929 [Solanum tuberosum]|nr:hypothetical protein KY289_007929 [Solanum tuberosum]